MENNMYEYFDIVKDCYDSLSDDLSRKVFQARMNLDLGIWDGYMKLIECSGLMKPDVIQSEYKWVKEFAETQKPLYIYGAGDFGGRAYKMLSREHLNIVGFFDRNYQSIKVKCGLPVLEPPTSDGMEDYYIFISPALPVKQIRQDLESKGIKDRHILNSHNCIVDIEHQYFDFLNYFDENGLFVDAGCFDCETSILFADYCKRRYKKIVAFEPDENNYKACLENAKKHRLDNIQFYQMGLWNQSEVKKFGALGNSCSFVTDEGEQTIHLASLDEIVRDEKVSFIKMDIEGSELQALQGAERTIKRDKPLCAISAYHKAGDQIALIHYLKQLVPEYRFALRHYSCIAVETLLYAFIK